VVASPWVARNVVQVGASMPSAGDAQVLSIRAEKATMTWREYAAAYIAYTPVIGQPILDRFVPRQHWERLRRSNPGSFFRLGHGIDPGGAVRARTGPGPVDDAVLRDASLAVIREHWVMSLALIPAFAWRGAFVEVGMTSLAAQGTTLPSILARSLAPFTAVWSLLLFPILLLSVRRAWRTRDGAWLLFLAPLLLSVAAHAVGTHYVPRYSHPLIPAIIVSGLLLLSTRVGRHAIPAHGAGAEIDVGCGH
jgi:hypothetical protein